jgi:hypothetical protein
MPVLYLFVKRYNALFKSIIIIIIIIIIKTTVHLMTKETKKIVTVNMIYSSDKY